MRSRKLLISLMFALFLFKAVSSSTSQAAQLKLPLEDSYLSIMPEYDKNNVIVNFTGTLVNTTDQTFSDEVWYYVPKDAEIYMVCETENGMVCVTYNDKTIEGDYRIVKWTPSRPIKPGERFPVMFEYFFNSFREPGLREFQVKFKADSAISNFTAEVKQPLRSSDFKMEPAAQFTQQDENGLTVHVVQYPDLKALQELTFAISYNKPDNKPSVAAGETVQVAGGTARQGGANKTFIYFLFSTLLIILGVVLYLGLKNSNSRGQLGKKRGKAPKESRAYSQQLTKNNNKAGKSGQPDDGGRHADEKRKIRKLLLDGKISEQTYNQLLEDLE